jgi:glycosyltransferase involved in cell wall biosynthesis
VQELADHIQNLYHNRLRLEELANNIRMFNQRYNWEIQKARYLDLVHGLTRY